MGGYFDEVGDNIPSLGIARFGATPVSTEPLPRATDNGWAIAIYPNPASSETTLAIELEQPARRLRVTLHDVLGRTIRTVLDGPVGSGRGHFAIPTGGLAAGVYLVRVYDGVRATTRRLVVL